MDVDALSGVDEHAKWMRTGVCGTEPRHAELEAGF